MYQNSVLYVVAFSVAGIVSDSCVEFSLLNNNKSKIKTKVLAGLNLNII